LGFDMLHSGPFEFENPEQDYPRASIPSFPQGTRSAKRVAWHNFKKQVRGRAAARFSWAPSSKPMVSEIDRSRHFPPLGRTRDVSGCARLFAADFLPP
jgi:hypothetical protein